MATLPVFRTWVVGEIVTAAFMNTNIRDNGNFLVARPIFEGRQTVAQSFTTATAAAVLLDTEDLDTDNGHSTVTNTSRYTAQTPGWLRCSGTVGWAPNATSRRGAWLRLTGTDVTGSIGIGPASATLQTSYPARTMHVQVNGTTDYVELIGQQESGGALLTAVSTLDQSRLSICWAHS